MAAIERSWLLKLVWLWTPFIPVTAFAIDRHNGGHEFGLLSFLPILILLPGILLQLIVNALERPARRARMRALSPQQRMQMSPGVDPAPLHETLRIASKPPVESLPRPLQAAIAYWGSPIPQIFAAPISILGLLIWFTTVLMAFRADPIGDLARWLGPLPLSYWPTFIALLAAGFVFTLWCWLREMHDHYGAAAKTTGRRPYPAL
jgi:hypothetical protein